MSKEELRDLIEDPQVKQYKFTALFYRQDPDSQVRDTVAVEFWMNSYAPPRQEMIQTACGMIPDYSIQLYAMHRIGPTGHTRQIRRSELDNVA